MTNVGSAYLDQHRTSHQHNGFRRSDFAVPTTATGPRLGSYGARALARLLDGVLVAVLMVLTVSLAAGLSQTLGFEAPAGSVPAGVRRIAGSVAGAMMLSAWVVPGLLVHAVVLKLCGTTPGKRALGLAVVPRVHDRPLTWLQALGRWGSWFVLALSGVGLLLNYLWPLWDPRRAALHDLAAGTAVVQTRT